jgi:hypothetical protein
MTATTVPVLYGLTTKTALHAHLVACHGLVVPATPREVTLDDLREMHARAHGPDGTVNVPHSHGRAA